LRPLRAGRHRQIQIPFGHCVYAAKPWVDHCGNAGSRPAAKNGLHLVTRRDCSYMTKQKGVLGEHCDMLVIGSLLGGNVAALELTEMGDGLRISAMWRRRADKDFAETTWDIERSVWPPPRLKGIQCIYWLAGVMVHAGAGIGSRVLQRRR